MKLFLASTALISCALAKKASSKTELILVSSRDRKGLELECSMAPPPVEIQGGLLVDKLTIDPEITWGRHYHNKNGKERYEHDIHKKDLYRNLGYKFSKNGRKMKFTKRFIGKNYRKEASRRNDEQLFHYSCCWNPSFPNQSADLPWKCMEFDVFDKHYTV